MKVINSARNVPQSFIWNISKPQFSKAEKLVLKNFFEIGPSTRQRHYDKLGKSKKGKSYNDNIEKLVQLNLLKHESLENWDKKSTDTSLIDNLELRKAIIKAYKTDNFNRPENFSKEEWKKGLQKLIKLNPKHNIDEIGESFYSLTVWGIIAHLKNEGKMSRHQVIFFLTEEDTKSYDSQSDITDEDLDLILRHFEHFFEIIPRKWKYLCENNDPGLVYEKLFHILLLADYYYEVFNVSLEKFEQSAVDDICMSFFMPYMILPEYSEKWIQSIVRDNEIYDYLMFCLEDLQENYNTNQEIIAEYKNTLNSFKTGKKLRKIKLHQFNRDFKRPTSRKKYRSISYYSGKGYWSYFLSNFLNVLDFGPLNYQSQLTEILSYYRKKRGPKIKKNSF